MVLGGAILAKKGLDKAKKSSDNFINNQRDKGFGGNTRPGADQIYFGDKKKNTKNYLEHKDKVISTNYETCY